MKENIIILVILFSTSTLIRILTRIREDISYMNYTLYKLSIKSGIIDEGEIDIELKKLISKGEKARAIKLYMTLLQVDFKSSREYVNKLIENKWYKFLNIVKFWYNKYDSQL